MATPGSRDVLSLPPHPAKFSETILTEIQNLVWREARSVGRVILLDPFAGTGRIHQLYQPGLIETFGVELEPEWAAYHERTQVGSALDLPFAANHFHVVATSPTYGNRMADSHEARDSSRRMTYKHQLGRHPTDGSSSTLQWGDKYREFHVEAWTEVWRVLRPGGLFIMNCKNHIRTVTRKGVKSKEEQLVCEWHVGVLVDMGFRVEKAQPVTVPGMKFGSNHKDRVAHEMVYALRKT